MRRLRSLCVLAVLSVSQAAFAQSYHIDAWTADDGLPQNPVNNVIQTRDGFIWLATFAGLVRYDGGRLEVFNTVTTPALRTSRFTDLFEDREGNLWASTEAAGVMRYRNGVFETYSIAEGLPAPSARPFFYDPDGRLLLATDKGLVHWNGQRFVPWPAATVGRPGTRILQVTDSALWTQEGDSILKHERGAITRRLRVPDLRWFYEDRRGRLWIEVAVGTERVLDLIDGDHRRRFSAADGVPGFRTMTVAEPGDGALWFGLRGGGGLMRFSDGRFTRFTTADGLPSNNVGKPVQDREGSLWVPTEGGLARMTERVVSAYSSTHGLAADNTYPIYQDPDGDVWIGGWPGLTRYRHGVFESVGAAHGVADRFVTAIFRERGGAMWLGVVGWGGVVRVHRGRVQSFTEPIAFGAARAIHQDRDGDVWLGGDPGLVRYRQGVMTRLGAAEGFSPRNVLTIVESRRGGLWLGTDLGLSEYRDGRFVHYGTAEGFTGTNVRAIHEDRSGALWLGTYDSGLFRFAGGRFHRFTTRDGLFDNGAFRILEDSRGYLWMSSNVGIYRVSRVDLELVAEGRASRVTSLSYGRRDGMLTAECNGGGQPAGIRAADGRLWFPTQRGVVVIDAERLPVNTVPPPVVITTVSVEQQPHPAPAALEIAPHQNSFEIQYAGLTYVRPDLTRFRYKLEGLDAGWTEAGNRRTAYFSHVPYGRYTFVVTAANRDGVWNETGARVAVIVRPPFYRTWWFQTMLVVALCAGAYAAHRRHVRALRQEQALHDEHARQLIDVQERDRKRVAAEIHDSLSQNLVLIGNWARRAAAPSATPADTHEALNDIATTTSAALREVQEIAYNLGPYQLDRLGFSATIRAGLARASSASGIRFEATVDDIDGMLAKDVEISVYRMIQEGVNNIVKHSGATSAAVAVSRDGKNLSIVIQDNGRGFPLPAGSDGKPRGFGLVGLGERARIMGGTCAIDSASGFGTRIDVTLPLNGSSTRHVEPHPDLARG